MKISAKFLSLIIIVFLLASCKSEKKPVEITPENISLKKVNEFEIDVPEPSDLALGFDGHSIWTVSDENSTVYLLDFDGKVKKKFSVKGNDLEGITVINENKIAVILERTREAVILTTDGKEILRHKFDLKGKPNSGLEGITYDPDNQIFYLLNEKSPGLLLKCDMDFNILSRHELKFAKDYSAIYYDRELNDLWILSDESVGIYICDTAGTVKQNFKLEIPQMEGLAVDKINNRVYIVSDNTEKIYVFDLKYKE